MKPSYLLLLLGVCLAWGFHVIVIKTTVGFVSPLTYVAFRMVILAALLSPLLRWHQGKMLRIAIGGACFGGINYVFMFSGLQYLTASIGAVLMESYVVVATIFSVLFLGETVGWKRGSGIAAALVGVLVIATADGDLTGSANLPLGAALILIAMASEATGALFVKKIDGVRPLQLLAWFALVGCVLTVSLAVLIEDDHFAWTAGDRAGALWAALGYSVLIASIFGHASYYLLLQRLPLSIIAPSGLLITLVAVSAGVLLLGEKLTPRVILGASLVLAGVAVVLVRSNRPDRKQTLAEAAAAEETVQ